LGVNGTAATGINNLGQIVGYYLDSNNVQHGYLYSNGTYITLDDPLGSHATVATGINDSGQIVGFYLDGSSPFPPRSRGVQRLPKWHPLRFPRYARHCPRLHRRCWPSRPDLGERWPSRLVATAEEDRLGI
jgi:probable HAF family extracellular repeat protein